jgi:hypothetical protein
MSSDVGCEAGAVSLIEPPVVVRHESTICTDDDMWVTFEPTAVALNPTGCEMSAT